MSAGQLFPPDPDPNPSLTLTQTLSGWGRIVLVSCLGWGELSWSWWKCLVPMIGWTVRVSQWDVCYFQILLITHKSGEQIWECMFFQRVGELQTQNAFSSKELVNYRPRMHVLPKSWWITDPECMFFKRVGELQTQNACSSKELVNYRPRMHVLPKSWWITDPECMFFQRVGELQTQNACSSKGLVNYRPRIEFRMELVP